MIFASDEEAIKRINKPLNSSAIELAKVQEGRLLLHSESILEKYNLPWWAYRNFTLWWQCLVTKEKHNKIDQLITTPLASLSLVEDIARQIGKFRDAQDRYVSFDFNIVDYTNDYEDFLTRINDDSFWRDTCMEGVINGICNVLVIDLPSVQTTFRPEPYQYFVSPSSMTDIDINKFTGNIEYFIFKQSKFKWDSALNTTLNAKFEIGKELEKTIVIDDCCYRVFAKGDGDWELLYKSEHDLGYTPCIDFWKPSIQGTNGINKKGILTNLLSKLDKFVFYSALVDYMDIYGAFPIFVTYSMEEEQYDSKRKDVNFGDYYSPSTSSYVGSDKGESQNPRTSYRWMGAPGSILEYQQPADANDNNFVKDSPHFINMPVDALRHVNDRCKSLKNELIEYATGQDREYMNEIAKNPEMFDASFSKQDSIITFVKRQLERVHQFSTKTRICLRYGKEYFNSCTVDYGSDYFLKDAGKIVQEYEDSVKAGMPPEYSYQIAKEATNTRFKNNVDILARQRIMRDLIPYQDCSIQDLVIAGVSVGDVKNFVLRINSTTFISQFELDYGDIVKFGSTMSYSDKIYFIKNKLQDYGNKINWTAAKPAIAGGSK